MSARSKAGRELLESFRWRADQVDPNDPAKRSYRLIVIDKLIALACSGEIAAIKEFNERVFGKVKDQVEHSGSIGHEYELTPFPDKAPTVDAWASRYADAKKPEGVN